MIPGGQDIKPDSIRAPGGTTAGARRAKRLYPWHAMGKVGSTLSEVARRCGVSQSTVSRVINGSNPGRFSVSAEVRDRILRVAKELNYRPSVAARNLAVTKTQLVAVLGLEPIFSDRVGPLEEAVASMARALDRAGYEICVQVMSQRHGPFDLPPLRIDGVVAVGPRRMEDLSGLESSGTPYVCIDGVCGPTGSLVAPDDAGGMRLALRHLADLGHRRIAYLDNPTSGADHVSVSERRAAFARGTDEFRFDPAPVGLPPLSAETPWDIYYEPFVRNAVVLARATAVVAYSHHAALGLLRKAHDLGLSVPRDFSLICFNDEPIVRLSIPSLTAVNIPSGRMGQVAAELLLRQMGEGSHRKPERIKLDESLVVRESTAPPPKATGGRRQRRGGG